MVSFLPLFRRFGYFPAILLFGASAFSVLADQKAGPLPDGGYLLTNGWRIRSAGENIPLSTMPMSEALSPDGRFLAVLNGGYAPPTISIVDLQSGREIGRTDLHRGWRGLAFSGAGDRLFAGNGPEATVTEFAFSAGSLSDPRALRLFPHDKAAASHLTSDVQVVGGTLLAADCAAGRVAVVDIASGRVLRDFPTAPNPYALLVAPDRKSLFLSSWSTSRVLQYRIEDGVQLASLDVGPHPTGMAWLGSEDDASPRLAVACANTNRVFLFKQTEGSWLATDPIDVAMTPHQPVGMTPSALSYRAGRLYVACSDADAIAVVDVSGLKGRVLGFVPTGWYPTSVRALSDGRIVAVNGKGLRSFPNSNGLTPYKWPGSKKGLEHVALLQKGSISLIAALTDVALRDDTRTVLSNARYSDKDSEQAAVPRDSPIPARVGDPSPIRNVIIVMKEMRTYDQVLGDMPEGDGDSGKVQFGERITPNHHKLARDFVLLDNFYCAGDVSKDGYFWTSGAIAPDSTQRTWPMETSQALPVEARYDAGPEGFRTAPGGQLWDRARENGVSLYNYGFATKNLTNHPPKGSIQIEDVLDPVLKPHTNWYYPGHDPRRGNYDYSFLDIDRVGIFQQDLKAWERKGEMPRLILMNLGGDHTVGMSPGMRTPDACMADNDEALGRLVESVSHSAFWRETAIFVLWDDSQDGNDHVDCHRTPAYVISPYVKRHEVDDTFYNTVSMLRTIELILGFKPMTVFDAGAPPMASVFQSKPDLTPYSHEPARVRLDQKNPPGRLPTVHTGAE